MSEPNASNCPEHLRESIDAYVVSGRPTGGFLRAVLENDLCEAIGRADYINLPLVPHILAYIYNEIPSACWGSPAKVTAWLNRDRGLGQLSDRALFENEASDV